MRALVSHGSVILNPHLGPWHHLMDHMDPEFLLMTGLTREAFNTLLDIIKSPGHPALGKRMGHKWPLPLDAQLNLLLFFIGSRMAIHLCLLFCMSPLG
jgi:hypothetical protein